MYYPKERCRALSNSERGWLQIATKLAETSAERFKHGAIVVLGGAVQGLGINKNTLDPYIYKNYPKMSVHAEEAALRRCTRTQGATIYVSRVNNRGQQKMSRPCPKCMKLLIQAGVKRIVYTIDQVIELGE